MSLNVQSVIPFKSWWAKRQLEVTTTQHTVIRSISVSQGTHSPGQPVWLECQPELPSTQGKRRHSYSSVTITALSNDSFGCLEKHLQTIPAIPEITATALTCHVGISHINHLGAFLILLRRPEITLLFRRARARTRSKEHGRDRAAEGWHGSLRIHTAGSQNHRMLKVRNRP